MHALPNQPGGRLTEVGAVPAVAVLGLAMCSAVEQQQQQVSCLKEAVVLDTTRKCRCCLDLHALHLRLYWWMVLEGRGFLRG